MVSSAGPLIVNEINELVQEAQGTLALLLPETAANALLIWDTIITFDQEVELIWNLRILWKKFQTTLQFAYTLGLEYRSHISLFDLDLSEVSSSTCYDRPSPWCTSRMYCNIFSEVSFRDLGLEDSLLLFRD
ncbi:hypothetical protein Clacol_008613 [Clathrus columnatus]|uniref:DUF6533 domain-containing protein n=1 Tax=Clathrus columnatus TaxID=1419009 RepID=A0AAV5ANV3_9AGAM|nr:hypothetical protein Clacol_008613 [Clathrus columnatus]